MDFSIDISIEVKNLCRGLPGYGLPVMGCELRASNVIIILPPQIISCILHPASCILHPASCILHPASCILHPASCIKALKSRRLDTFSNIGIYSDEKKQNNASEWRSHDTYKSQSLKDITSTIHHPSPLIQKTPHIGKD
jgi:hypothetical protein